MTTGAKSPTDQKRARKAVERFIRCCSNKRISPATREPSLSKKLVAGIHSFYVLPGSVIAGLGFSVFRLVIIPLHIDIVSIRQSIEVGLQLLEFRVEQAFCVVPGASLRPFVLRVGRLAKEACFGEDIDSALVQPHVLLPLLLVDFLMPGQGVNKI